MSDAPEKLQVLLVEFLARILRVELDDAKGLAFRRAQRHAHHRTNVEGDDAVPAGRQIAAAPLAHQEGLAGFETLTHNGRTEIGGPFLGRVPGLHELRLERMRIFIDQNNEAAVGLWKE